MPSFVTVQGPNARIVCIVLNDHIGWNDTGTIICRRLQYMGIPPRRIRRIYHFIDIVAAKTLVDDKELVRVRGRVRVRIVRVIDLRCVRGDAWDGRRGCC